MGPVTIILVIIGGLAVLMVLVANIVWCMQLGRVIQRNFSSDVPKPDIDSASRTVDDVLTYMGPPPGSIIAIASPVPDSPVGVS